jgi:hypothetical protein
MTSNQIPLAAQATAVRRAAVNLQGHVDNLKRLVARRQRPEIELDRAGLAPGTRRRSGPNGKPSTH